MADKYDQSKLIAAIEAYEAEADTAGLSEDRAEALDRYLGEPMGNEVDGHSQVVSRDTWDTIEWIKPQLADIFCGGDEVVAFSPRGPEDEKPAEQETDYVNYTITQRNNWFEIWNNWSHDGLLQKVGYVKAYFDDSEDRTKEKYQGLTEEEMMLLMEDPDVELIDVEEKPLMGGMFPMMTYDATFERIRSPNVVRVVNVAPENVKVAKRHRSLSLQDPRLPFCEHTEKKTISELRAEGFDVEDDISDTGTSEDGEESAGRDSSNTLDDENTDPAMRLVTVREVWIRHDCDEDGLAELRHVIVVGSTVLLDEEATVVNLVALSPYILPHQHVGLSVYDAVKDLEEIKTALLRGGLNQQYLANNGRYAIDAEAVNLDDMLDSRPGGIVRTNGSPTQAIFPLTHPGDGSGAISMIEYIDHVKMVRTGVNEQSQGLDQNSLNKTFGGAQLLLTAAQQRIKFIARVLAETAVKPLFQVVHQLTLTHSRKESIAKLRGVWVPVDPRQWVKRQDMQISVALGAGDKPQQMAFLGQTLEMQMNLQANGLTDPSRVFNTLSRMSRVAGYKDPGEFWIDPSKAQQPAEQSPPPEVLAEQAKGQVQLAIADKKSQADLQKAQITAQVQRANKQDELQVQQQNDERDAQRQMLQAQLDRQAEQSRQQFELLLQRMEQAQERYEANLDARVRLAIAGMTQQTAMQQPAPGGFNA